MAKAGGYVFIVPEGREGLFEECIRNDERFSEPVDDFAHTRSAPLICFVVADGESISYIARGRKGLVAGTALRRLNIEEPAKLETPISISSIVNAASKKFSGRISTIFQDGGMITPKTFEEIVEVLSGISKEASLLLARFSKRRTELIAKLQGRVRENLAEQKEAISTALAIANIDRSVMLEWTPPTEEQPSSFLDGLPAAVMREDPMVVNDLMNVPGYSLVKTLPYSAAVFEGNGTRLTVLLTNRLPLETLLGTDLIYYNETYKSFVMVQYKAMGYEDEDHQFRLPSDQLEKELARMEAVNIVLKKHTGAVSLEDYRLNEAPFFMKLCPRMNFNPDDTKLFPGMYFPLSQWRLIEKSPSIIGVRGGKAVTYGNVGRYMDNTFFTSLVSGAWVGTNTKQSKLLERVIRETLASGKAVALASLSKAVIEPA